MKKRMGNGFQWLFLLFFCLMAGAAEWRQPKAELRLCVNIPNPGEGIMYVPVPDEYLGRIQGCEAYLLKGGKRLPVQPIAFGGRTIGFHVDFGSNIAAYTFNIPPLGAEVFFLEKPVQDGPAFERKDFIANFQYTGNVTTRALTAEEMQRLFLVLGRPSPVWRSNHSWPVASFGEVSQVPKPRQHSGQHALACFSWTGQFYLDTPVHCEFGTGAAQCAWTVLVDGVPVANWTEAEQRDGRFVGKSVSLGKGVHTIQYLAARRNGETVPRLLVSIGGQPWRPVQNTFSAALPRHFTLQKRDKAEEKLAFGQMPQQCLVFPHAGGSLLVQKVTEGAQAKTILTDAARPQTWSKAGVTFHGLQLWYPGERVDTRTRFLDLEGFYARNAVIPLRIALEGPALAKEIAAALQLERVILDEDGNVLEQSAKAIGASLEVLDEVKLPEKAALVRYAFTAASVPVYPSLELAVLHPNSVLKNLEVSGNALFFGEKRAICLCDALQKLSFAGQADLKPESIFKIAILDELSADAAGPGASRPLDEAMANLEKPSALALPEKCSVIRYPAENGVLGVLPAFVRLVEARPGMAVLLLGQRGLCAGVAPAQNCLPMLFMAQACRSWGIVPVAVALPPLPGISEADARLAALYTKETALSCGIPVADFYSRLRAQNSGTEEWFTASGARLAIPGNGAREWLATQLLRALAPVLHNNPER